MDLRKGCDVLNQWKWIIVIINMGICFQANSTQEASMQPCIVQLGLLGESPETELTPVQVAAVAQLQQIVRMAIQLELLSPAFMQEQAEWLSFDDNKVPNKEQVLALFSASMKQMPSFHSIQHLLDYLEFDKKGQAMMGYVMALCGRLLMDLHISLEGGFFNPHVIGKRIGVLIHEVEERIEVLQTRASRCSLERRSQVWGIMVGCLSTIMSVASFITASPMGGCLHVGIGCSVSAVTHCGAVGIAGCAKIQATDRVEILKLHLVLLKLIARFLGSVTVVESATTSGK